MYALAAGGAVSEMLKFIALEALTARETGKILMLGTDFSTYDLLANLSEIQSAGVPVYLAPERAIRSLVHKVKYERIRRHLLDGTPLPGAVTSA